MNLSEFCQTFNEKVQEALKNLLSAFGNKNSSAEASVSVFKRATNPLQLINDLDDPEAKHNAEEALKKLFSFLEQFKSHSSEPTEASVTVAKRLAQDFLGALFAMATGQGRQKRDVAEEPESTWSTHSFSCLGRTFAFLSI
uniref:Uncharacterized protein n=1 Tax=Tetranychus urticae TaxID=32264 RepID=T1L191_TETUR